MGDLRYAKKHRRSHVLWVVCLIQASLCVQGITARCQGLTGMGLSLYPEGVLKVKYGNHLEIFCVAEEGDADDIEFRSGPDTLPSEKVNITTRRLYIQTPDRGVFAYYCKNNKNKRYCVSRAVVDSAPENVSNFACKSKNFENLSCTWTPPKSFTRVDYSLSYIMNGMDNPNCTSYRAAAAGFCSVSVTAERKYGQMEKYLNFVLTSSNDFGSNLQYFTVDYFAVVQPAKVFHLNIINIDRYEATLRWIVPYIIDLLPNGIEHKVEYQVNKIDNTSYFRSVDTSMLPQKNKTYQFLLSNLPYAHAEYKVRVCIKPIGATDEFWSDPTTISFNTTGISIEELNRLIYAKWRKHDNRLDITSSKLWHMKATERLTRNWDSVKNSVTSLLNLKPNGQI